MKRVISLIISIAMVASLAAGLAVTGMAEGASKLSVYLKFIDSSGVNNILVSWENGTLSTTNWTSHSDYLTVTTETNDKYIITVEDNVEIDIIAANSNDLVIDLNGKKLTVNECIQARNLTIQGGGTLEAIADETAMSCGGNIKITGANTIVNVESDYCGIQAENITIDANTVSVKASGDYATGIWANGANSELKINGGIVDITASGTNSYGIYAGNETDLNKNVTISGKKVTITAGGDNATGIAGKDVTISSETIEITASGNNAGSIYAENNITINGSTVNAKATSNGIMARLGDVIIKNSDVTAEGETQVGIFSSGGDIIINNPLDKIAKAKGPFAFMTDGSEITINGELVTQDDIKNGDLTYEEGVDCYITVANPETDSTYPGFAWICSTSGDPVIAEEDNNDPEVEIDFGYVPVIVKTSGKSLVLNDSKIIEKEVLESNNLFVHFDLTMVYIANTKQTKDFDAIFLNNDVYKFITGAGKGIELITRNGKAQAFPIDLTIDNPVSFHFEDVKDIPGKCATAIQKKAMNTTKVYAELEYSYVTNGRQIDSPARMYVPVDGEAKVFFIINENTLGSIPCETRNGYCVFNRYFDGTYIICAK